MEIKKKAEIKTFNNSDTESVVNNDEEYQSTHSNSNSNNDNDPNNNNDDTSGGNLKELTVPPLYIPILSTITTTESASIGSVTLVSVTAPLVSINVSTLSMKARSL